MSAMSRYQRIFLPSVALTLASICLVYYVIFLETEIETSLKNADSIVNRCDRFEITKDVKLPTVCDNQTCQQAYLRHLQTAGNCPISYPIPAVRHLIWRSEYVSAYFAAQLHTWKTVHPQWTVVLWRDEDLKPFVKKHFPAALRRILELRPYPIMQVDMIRYMLLYKYGGVYADLDYSLLASLDAYRRYHAVLTREPEAHSLLFFGFRWPPRPMANPAFMMSAPGHSFHRHCIERLQSRPFVRGQPLAFAGPVGLTWLLDEYANNFPLANDALETVYVPPSFSFYPYEANRMNSSTSRYVPARLRALIEACKKANPSWPEQLLSYCKDPNNMDPITDKSQPIVAVHDMKKTGAIYDGIGTQFYMKDLQHIRGVLGDKLEFGSDWL